MSKKKKCIYGIVGLGRFGFSLLSELSLLGAEIIVIDNDEDKVTLARDYTENAFVVKNIDKHALVETGIQNCDVVVVCVGEKIDKSILLTLNLISMGIPKVISKANSLEHGEVLEKLGADVVYPERDMAIKLANRLETANMLDFVQLSKRINISKLIIPESAIGKKVVDLNLRGRFGLNIIAIESGKNLIDNIDPQYVFKEKDILFLSGSNESFLKLAKWVE